MKEDVVVRDNRVKARDLVWLLYAAANRDRERFSDPEVFNHRRSPNPHLAFAAGAHFCLGAPLARLEAAVAVGTMLDRWPSFRLRPDLVQYLSQHGGDDRKVTNLRAFKSIPAMSA
jgi:cytochrome P450